MIESSVKKSLQALQSAIRSADADGITAAVTQLDRLTAEHTGQLNPQLLHFLQRRSYEKALAFLGGDEDIPSGSCGGRR